MLDWQPSAAAAHGSFCTFSALDADAVAYMELASGLQLQQPIPSLHTPPGIHADIPPSTESVDQLLLDTFKLLNDARAKHQSSCCCMQMSRGSCG
jgi:hypothetical protein